MIKATYDKSVLPTYQHCPFFVNRKDEIKNVTNFLNFHSSNTQVVNVVGSPSFGKSCIAINVGHDMIQRGVIVNYVNLHDIHSMDTLATRILNNARFSLEGFSPQTALLEWLKRLKDFTLLIFDDCDDFVQPKKLTKKYTDFKVFIVNLTGLASECPLTLSFKVLLTSRTSPLYLRLLTAPFEEIEIKELQFKHADDMIMNMVPHLNSSIRHEIAELTGNLPLALRITGVLLSRRHPVELPTVLSRLKNDPIPFLTDELNPEEATKLKPVGTSINVSYMYLGLECQRCGRLLANLPGSFVKETAHAILSLMENVTDQCLTALVESSLLEYDKDTDRYVFHRLIRLFFVYVQQLMEPSGSGEVREFKAQFFHHFTEYLDKVSQHFESSDLLPSEKGFGSEEHNFMYLLENLRDVANVVNHSTADHYMHLVARAFVTKFLVSDVAAGIPLNTVIKYFNHSIKQNPSFSNESFLLYGQLVDILLRSSVSSIQIIELNKSFPVTCKSPSDFQSAIDYVVFIICNRNTTSPTMNPTNPPICDDLHHGEVGLAYYRNAEYKKAIFYLSSFLNPSSSIIVEAVENLQYFYRLYRAYLHAGNHFEEVRFLIAEHPITKRYLSGKFDIPILRKNYGFIETIMSYLWATSKIEEAIAVQNQILAYRMELKPWLHTGGKKFDLRELCMVVRHATYEDIVVRNYSGAIALIENALERFQKRKPGEPIYRGTPCITTIHDIDGYFYSLFYYGKTLISARHFRNGVEVIENVMDGVLDMHQYGQHSHCQEQLLSLVCSYRIYEGDPICVIHILSSLLCSLHAVLVEGEAFDLYFQANVTERAYYCVCNSSGAFFADSVSTMQWLSFSMGFMEVGCALVIIVILSMIVVLIILYIFRILLTVCNFCVTLALVFGVVALCIMQYEIRV